MNRSLFRAAASTCAAAALTFTFLAVPASSPSQAASLTISDPNCDSFTLTGSAPNQTLNCIVSSVPVCTVTGPTTGTINTANTMSASCSPAATTWVWSSDVGSGCNSMTTQSCQDTQTATGTVNYKVTGSNGQGAGPQSAAYPVVWSNTPPAKPSGCSIVQSNPSGTLPVGGGTTTLTANCTVGGSVTWSWAGGFAGGQTTAGVTGNVASTTTFTATATNGAGSTAANYTVQVNTGGGGNISCAGFAATHTINVTWGVTAQTQTAPNGGFGPLDAVVLVFTAPATGGTLTRKGTLAGVEFGDAPSPRYGTVSTVACDFAGTSAVSVICGGTQIFCTANGTCSNDVSFSFAFNPTKTGSALLVPGTKYYVNVANNAIGSCVANGSCNMIFNWGWPTQ